MPVTNKRFYGGDKDSSTPAPTAGEVAAGNESLRGPGATVPADHNVPQPPSLDKPSWPGAAVPEAGTVNVPRATSAAPPPRPASDAGVNPSWKPGNAGGVQ
jgi:hypothetical protein